MDQTKSVKVLIKLCQLSGERGEEVEEEWMMY